MTTPLGLAIEPEGIMYTVGELPPLSLDYLRGFRDAADSIYSHASQRSAAGIEAEVAAAFVDTAALTWGLQAAQVDRSSFSGKEVMPFGKVTSAPFTRRLVSTRWHLPDFFNRPAA